MTGREGRPKADAKGDDTATRRTTTSTRKPPEKRDFPVPKAVFLFVISKRNLILLRIF